MFRSRLKIKFGMKYHALDKIGTDIKILHSDGGTETVCDIALFLVTCNFHQQDF